MPPDGSSTLTLAIEMSNPSIAAVLRADPLVSGEVAVGVVGADGARLLGVEPIVQQTPRDDALATTIDRLLRRLDIQPARLERIAVSAGPGGFTSVRISMITAKVIAEAVGARVVVVPTDEVVARSIRRDRPGDQRSIAVTLTGKRDTAWCAVFGPCGWDGGPWPAPTIEGVMTAEAFAGMAGVEGVGLLVADAFAPKAFHDWALRAGVEVTPPALGAKAVLIASQFREAVDPALALPIYPREPEAVTKWRDRAGS